MRKVHVTQDDHRYWFISMEEADGSMKVVAHQYVAQKPAIEDAQDLIRQESRRADPGPGALAAESAPGIVMVVDPPRRALQESVGGAPAEYKIPAPRRAGE